MMATANYVYDGDGNRVKADFGGSVTVYPLALLRAGVGGVYEKTTSGSSTTITKYYQAGDQRTSPETSASSDLGELGRAVESQSRRVALRVNGVVRWLASDHLGSTSITASETGARIAELRYKPWGETRYSFGVTPTPRRFTGQVLDSVAGGVYYYNARYYDPALGRFIQADTIVPNLGNPQAST